MRDLVSTSVLVWAFRLGVERRGKGKEGGPNREGPIVFSETKIGAWFIV